MIPALRGREILLVDDVLTSGRTIHQVIRQLQRLGAGAVTVGVVAVTEAEAPGVR